MTEYKTCSTCQFLSGGNCVRFPPYDKYGEWPPIAYPDRMWCGEHQFAEGPAPKIADDPPTFLVGLSEPVGGGMPNDTPTKLDDARTTGHTLPMNGLQSPHGSHRPHNRPRR